SPHESYFVVATRASTDARLSSHIPHVESTAARALASRSIGRWLSRAAAALKAKAPTFDPLAVLTTLQQFVARPAVAQVHVGIVTVRTRSIDRRVVHRQALGVAPAWWQWLAALSAEQVCTDLIQSVNPSSELGHVAAGVIESI